MSTQARRQVWPGPAARAGATALAREGHQRPRAKLSSRIQHRRCWRPLGPRPSSMPRTSSLIWPAYESLPVDLRRTVDHAAAAVQVYGTADFHTKNAIALERLRAEFKSRTRAGPDSSTDDGPGARARWGAHSSRTQCARPRQRQRTDGPLDWHSRGSSRVSTSNCGFPPPLSLLERSARACWHQAQPESFSGRAPVQTPCRSFDPSRASGRAW